MTDEMSTKLRDIFDTLFGIVKPSEEKGEDPSKKKNKGNIKFNPERPEVKLTQDLVIKAHITRRDGGSAVNAEVLFNIKDPKVAKVKAADTMTDFAGVASVTIEGVTIDETTMTLTATIKEEIDGQISSAILTGSVTIKVIQ